MGEPKSIAVLGAGEFAREVRWLIEEMSACGGHAYLFVGPARPSIPDE